MISIIVCSIDPRQAAKLKQNIAETIDVPFEFIAFDNRTTNYGITKVYNLCARQAQYDLLCFAHEDIQFDTPNWGSKLLEKATESDCGVIGFAGSAAKTQTYSGWDCGIAYRAMNLIQHKSGSTPELYRYALSPTNFSQVIVLDGLCLFIPKRVWQEIPFDEVTFPGFHLYDLDISLAVSLHYKNYVCQSVLVEHFSPGAYSTDWFKYTLAFHHKWAEILPLYVNYPAKFRVRKNEAQTYYIFIKHLIKQQVIPPKEILSLIQKYWQQFPWNKYALKLWLKIPQLKNFAATSDS